MINKLQAFDGLFTLGQLQTIVNMSLHAEYIKINLHDLLKSDPPKVKAPLPKESGKVLVKHFKAICPRCGKVMSYSPVGKDSEKYKEGYRTYLLCGASCCNGKGCGYQDFVKFYIIK